MYKTLSTSINKIVCGLKSPNPATINTLMPEPNGWHFEDMIFKRIFYDAIIWILNKILLECIPESPINKKSALV